MLPIESSLEAPGLNVWERNQPSEKGFAFHDLEFERGMMKRATIDVPTTNVTEEPTTPLPIGTVISFRDFRCNLVAQHWVCAQPASPFCVFFDRAVPAATRIVVKPLTSKVSGSTSADKWLLQAKCGSQIQVVFSNVSV